MQICNSRLLWNAQGKLELECWQGSCGDGWRWHGWHGWLAFARDYEIIGDWRLRIEDQRILGLKER